MTRKLTLSVALMWALVPMLGCGGCQSSACTANRDCNALLSNDEVCHGGECLPRECGGALDVFGCGLFSRDSCINGRCVEPLYAYPPDDPDPDDREPDMGEADWTPPLRLAACSTPAPEICDPARATEWAAATIDSPGGRPAGPPACEPGTWWLGDGFDGDFRLSSTDRAAPLGESSQYFADAVTFESTGTRVVSLAPQTFRVDGFTVRADETLVLVSPCWGDTVVELTGRIHVSDGGTLVLSGVSVQYASFEPALTVETGGRLAIQYSALSNSGPVIEARDGSQTSIVSSSMESDGVALQMGAADAWVLQTRFGSGSPISIRGTDDALSARLMVVSSVFELFGSAVGIDAERAVVAVVDTRVGASDGDEAGFIAVESLIGVADSQVTGGRISLQMADSRAFVSGSTIGNAGWGIFARSTGRVIVPDDHRSPLHFPAGQLSAPPHVDATSLLKPESLEPTQRPITFEEAAPRAFPATFALASTAAVEQLAAADAWPAVYLLDATEVRSTLATGLQVAGGLVVLDASSIHTSGGSFVPGELPDARNAHGAYITNASAVVVTRTSFHNNTGTGLYVAGSAEPIRIEESRFRSNALGGMWAGDAPAIEIFDSTFERNDLFGLSTWSSPLLVVQSQFAANGPFTYSPILAAPLADGMLVTGSAQLEVIDSEIRDHTQYGLYAHDVTSLILDRNQWSGNLLDGDAAGNAISDVGVSGTAPQSQGSDAALDRILSAPERVPVRDGIAPELP